MKLVHPDRFEADITPNMTPMIDVVFLLLVFFLAAAQLSVGSQDDVELPVAPEAKRIDRLSPETVTIEIKWIPGGAGYEISGKPYTFEDLLRRLGDLVAMAEFRNRPLPPIILRADYRVQYREIQRLMYGCASLGIEVFNFQAEPKKETSP